MDPTRREASSNISAVGRATQIIESLVGRRDGLSVKELSDSLNLTPGVVSRILGTLQLHSWVYQHPLTNRFHLTYKLLRLAYGHAESLGLDTLCLPIMRQVAVATGELVQLAAIDGPRMHFLLKVEGANRRLTVAPMLGRIVPLHATACGKCWLAFAPDHEVVERLGHQDLAAFTPHTITRLDVLMRDLQAVRERGFALEQEEWTPGVEAVAAPVFARADSPVVGALVISIPSVRAESDYIESLADQAVRAANRLGEVWPVHLEERLLRRPDHPAPRADDPPRGGADLFSDDPMY